MNLPSIQKTVAYGRWSRGKIVVDMCARATWPKGYGDGALKMMAAIAEVDQYTLLEQRGFPEAAELCRQFPKMEMRRRFNTEIEGPFVFDTDAPIDDDAVLVFVTARMKRRGRR